jgi:exonuclease III
MKDSCSQMCNCKKISCANKQCSCFKLGKKCGSQCKCLHCTNQPTPPSVEEPTPRSVEEPTPPSVEEPTPPSVEEPTPPSVEKPTPRSVEEPTPPSVEEINETVFLSSLKILSWNLCHFSFLDPDLSLKTTAEDAFKYILKDETPDILIFQEFPKAKGIARLALIATWMGDAYDIGMSEDEHNEHVFMWHKATVLPMKAYVDGFVRPIIKDGLIRPAGTMRFMDLKTKMPIIITSVHSKSGGGQETIDEFNNVFAQYDQKVTQRYGSKYRSKDGCTCHIVCGDFNLNPHKKNIVPEGWVATGSVKIKTSSGSKGYDFFFLNKGLETHYGFDQRVLVQHTPKNSAMSIKGISDHDPIVLTLWRYRH